MTTSSVDIIEKSRELNISSAVPDAAERIVTQFGARPASSWSPTGRHAAPADGRISGTSSPRRDGRDARCRRNTRPMSTSRPGRRRHPGRAGRHVRHRSTAPRRYTVTILEIADAGNTEVGSARDRPAGGGRGPRRDPSSGDPDAGGRDERAAVAGRRMWGLRTRAVRERSVHAQPEHNTDGP